MKYFYLFQIINISVSISNSLTYLNYLACFSVAGAYAARSGSARWSTRWSARALWPGESACAATSYRFNGGEGPPGRSTLLTTVGHACYIEASASQWKSSESAAHTDHRISYAGTQQTHLYANAAGVTGSTAANTTATTPNWTARHARWTSTGWSSCWSTANAATAATINGHATTMLYAAG